jgi:hypothetical protein
MLPCGWSYRDYIPESHLTTLKAELALAKQQIEDLREALGKIHICKVRDTEAWTMAREALAKWPRKE